MITISDFLVTVTAQSCLKIIKNFMDIPVQYKTLSKSILPTPLYRLDNLSDTLKANIYIKRDDLTGFGFGGNKSRKLDYLIADAIGKGAGTLICVGAVQSNFCRLSAAYGAALGLETHLVLGGEKPEKATGNLLLDYIFGGNIHFINSLEWDKWMDEANKLEKKLLNKGKKVYFMPIGGSTPVGAMGYVKAFLEIEEFSKKSGIYFTNFFHATASAGTQSGLIAGKILERSDTVITGIAVAKDKNMLFNEIKELCGEVCSILKIEFEPKDINVDDSYIGESYGAYTEETEEAINLFAKKEGILLDWVYSGKAASGMIDYIRKGRIANGENILFIHTGGNIQLFK